MQNYKNTCKSLAACSAATGSEAWRSKVDKKYIVLLVEEERW